jgi:type I site-specific restriction-modification system R (restriction) subunit
VEGFEDVQPDVPKDGASSSSSSASADTKDQVDSKKVAETTSAHPEKEKEKEIEKEEFQSATNELFKLGKMPSEHAEGPKLDVGQTVMKAMNSLDPNTITSMTSDTKKLLETQKGLMSMLNQMRPVLADGKELLQTFSGMFGNGGPMKL